MNREKTLTALTQRLDASDVRQRFVAHQFFESICSADVTSRDVALFLGQWWHPLHYFPTFLARCISVLPDISSKSAIARILSQETGDGRPDRAHETIFRESMKRAGFDDSAIIDTVAFPETTALVTGYERLSTDWLTALGGIYATEVTDLLMVSSIGAAVKQVTGQQDNEWVAVHMQQEPDHVEEAGHTMLTSFTVGEETEIVDSANQMWRLWTAFFDQLVQQTGIGR